jgi:Protein of unknown function (DUF3833)
MTKFFDRFFEHPKLRRFSLYAALFAALVTGACSTVVPDEYRAEKPVLELDKYFNGTLDAWGMFQDRSGKVIKRFTVVMRCTWVGDTGTLDEDFTYSDGTKEKRIWTIKKHAGGRYAGTAADVQGVAEGVASGNALNWKYVLKLPVDGKVIEVNLDDWMYLIDDKVMLNRAEMSKFGFKLGEVTLSFTKRPQ